MNLFNKCLSKPYTIVIKNLDTFLAIVGTILSLIILYLSYFSGLAQQDFGFVSLIACLVYLIFRDKIQEYKYNSLTCLNKTQILTLNIIFVISFIISVLLLRYELYYRPPIYFVLVSIAFATIAIEILNIRESEPDVKLIIFKIILLSLSFRAGLFYQYPSLIGTDTWAHIDFARVIENYGFIPTNDIFNADQYNSYPIFHVLIVSAKLVLLTDMKNALFLSICIFSIIYTIFIYFMGNSLKNRKIGLLAMMLANISDMLIVTGVTNITTGSLVIGFFLIILCLTFNSKIRKSEYQVLILLLTFVIVMTHQLTTFASLMISMGMFIGSIIYIKFFKYNSRMIDTITRSNFSGTYIVFFTVLLLFVWGNTSLSTDSSGLSFLQVMARTLYKVITKDLFSDPLTSSQYVVYYNQFSTLSNILYHPGFLILFFFSIIGLLVWVSQKEITQKKIEFISALAICFLFIYGTPLIGFQDALLPHRWLPFEYIFLVLLASQGLYIIINHQKRRIIFTAFLIFLITFFMLTTPYIDQDSPLYNQDRTYRSTYTLSEIHAVNSIIDKCDRNIEVDATYRSIFIGTNFKGNVSIINAKGEKNGDIKILRNFLLWHPTQVSQSGSLARVRFATLGKQFFDEVGRTHNKIYNNGEVSEYE